MQLNKLILASVFHLVLLINTNSSAAENQEYTAANFEQDINPGLYPPLSTGEASPWQDSRDIGAPDSADKGNPWGAAKAAPVHPQLNVIPLAPYGYQWRPQTPYYYPPQQGYGYAPPNYGYVPNYGYSQNYPLLPYGNYGPFNGLPFNFMPFNATPFNGGPFNYNGGDPFGFSMPWPF